ncbi:MAG: hypothetical protein IJZ25_03230 [Lachnospiraceae bacterium]|nr:hypothetical protein [Lachnospiraceae bacterium]
MTATDWILLIVLIVIIGAAVAYIVKSKKSGVKCIGCPSGCSCSGKKNEHSACSCSGSESSNAGCCCGCHSNTKTD